MNAVQYKSALVLGLGISGESATELLLREGCAVVAVDQSGTDTLDQRAQRLRAAGADVELGVADLSDVVHRGSAQGAGFDVCVVSPGIAVDTDWLMPVRDRGISLLSELELGATRCRSPLIAVTGSNGKSTCTKLCGLALEKSGSRVALAGNYGIPISSVALDDRTFDWIVVEVSSFQLETVCGFRPDVAVLLNIQPDHLDRHGDMDTYIGLKARMFDHLGPGHVAAVHDEALECVKNRTKGHPVWRTFGKGPNAEYRYKDGEILYKENGQPRSVSLKGTGFCTEVTGLTAAAVLSISGAVGVSTAGFGGAVKTYEPLPHRMEEIDGKGGIRFIDDSKATNLGAMCGALEMVHGPVRLIAGGLLKEGHLENVKEMLAKSVKSVYLIGHSAVDMGKAWGGTVGCTICCDLDDAVRMAWRDAEAGDVIVLSPGCASFDQFRDYRDRGERFKAIVKTLINGKDVDHED